MGKCGSQRELLTQHAKIVKTSPHTAPLPKIFSQYGIPVCRGVFRASCLAQAMGATSISAYVTHAAGKLEDLLK